MIDYPIPYKIENVHVVTAKDAYGDKIDDPTGKGVAVYFPSTGTLYATEGQTIRASAIWGNPSGYVLLGVLNDFVREFSFAKDGSDKYFEKGGYVSMIVDPEERFHEDDEIHAMEQRIKKVVEDEDLARYIWLKNGKERLERDLRNINNELEKLSYWL